MPGSTPIETFPRQESSYTDFVIQRTIIQLTRIRDTKSPPRWKDDETLYQEALTPTWRLSPTPSLVDASTTPSECPTPYINGNDMGPQRGKSPNNFHTLDEGGWQRDADTYKGVDDEAVDWEMSGYGVGISLGHMDDPEVVERPNTMRLRPLHRQRYNYTTTGCTRVQKNRARGRQRNNMGILRAIIRQYVPE